MSATIRNVFFWTFTTITILFAGILTFASFDEWLNVGYNGLTGNYPWGLINENPWYYASPKIYSRVMLTEFIFLTVGLGLTIYFLSKRGKEKKKISLLGLWGIMILILVNGFIQR